MRILVSVAVLLVVAACGTTTTTATDAGGDAGTCAASPSGTHTGTCPSVLFQGVPNFDVPCTDRCLACNPTGPDGGPGSGPGIPCVCTGTKWACPSNVGCSATAYQWYGSLPPSSCP